ncbi:spindle and kinetochore-associated protein 1-like [Vespa mandarinia]|uniref:spindle and kinetochore-associated protein 1-like n=1 Tax=Vespa mandarinia TaxID=7446 RepID=UPI00161C1508|nr:spindle and kinetochore-associated protein 1-like [Vespa mandarinia]XP_047357339.1 spindle and kinetochore-associated protein 1-like [Vespa velutina]
MECELSIENLIESQCEILDRLQMETTFIKSRNNLKEILVFVRDSILDISSGICILRKYLDQLKENNDSSKKMILLYQNLNEKIIDMYKNVPEELLTAYANNNKSESMQSINDACSVTISSHASTANKNKQENVDFNDMGDVKKSAIKDCKKALFNEPEYPKISLIKEEEFDQLPKYMIGRQSLQMINGLINSINLVLKAKYTLLSAGKIVARKKGELDLYLYYRKQDIICEGNECKYFFTAEDYERYIKVKLDRLALKLMMALRHCKRIREYRLKKELYYIVLN